MNGILVAQMSQLWEGPRTVITHLHIQQMRTQGEVGGKPSAGSTHVLSIPLSVPLSPPPMAKERVLGRMTFVQLRAPPGYFRQAKLWGVAGRCPPIQGLFQSELAGPGNRGSCSKPRQRCYRLSSGVRAALCLSVLSAPAHLELSTQGGDGMKQVSVCVLRKWANMVWGRVAGQFDKLGVVCSAGNSKEGQDGFMSLVLS